MKVWGALALLLAAGGPTLLTAGCAASPRAAVPAGETPRSGGRDYADRLRVETAYRPAPTGGECVTCWYELPRGSYIAQGWMWNACCSVYPSCGHGGSVTWRRGRDSYCEPRPAWCRKPYSWRYY